MKNWVYYMREGIKNMWPKKKKKTTLAGIEISEKQTEHEFTTDVITFNKKGLPNKHPFRDREFPGAFEINTYGDDDWANPEEVENKK